MTEELLTLPMEPEQRISRLLRQIERERRQTMDRLLRPCGLQGESYLLLLMVHHFPGASQEELAGYLSTDRGNLARMAQKLEKQRYLCRTPLPDNRRRYSIRLTPEGEGAVQMVLDALHTWQNAATRGLSAEDKQHIIVWLGQILQNSRLPGPGQM